MCQMAAEFKPDTTWLVAWDIDILLYSTEYPRKTSMNINRKSILLLGIEILCEISR